MKISQTLIEENERSLMTKIGTYLLKYLVRKVSFDIKTGHKLDSVKLLRMNPKTFDDKIL